MEYHNKNNTIYDYFIMACTVIIVLLFVTGWQYFQLMKKPESNVVILNDSVFFAQTRYDSIMMESYHTMDSLELVIGELKKERKKVVVKYKTIHDTILSTPKEKQFPITKELCPGTKDTVDLQQINLCLEEGNKAKESLLICDEIITNKDTQLESCRETIVAANKNMETKDLFNHELVKQNKELSDDVEKEKSRKNTWRGITVGFIGVVIALLVL